MRLERWFPVDGVGVITAFMLLLLLLADAGAVTVAVIVVLTTGLKYVVAGSLSTASYAA